MTTILAQLSDPHLRVGPDDQGSIVPEPPAFLVHTADVAHVQPV